MSVEVFSYHGNEQTASENNVHGQGQRTKAAEVLAAEVQTEASPWLTQWPGLGLGD